MGDFEFPFGPILALKTARRGYQKASKNFDQLLKVTLEAPGNRFGAILVAKMEPKWHQCHHKTDLMSEERFVAEVHKNKRFFNENEAWGLHFGDSKNGAGIQDRFLTGVLPTLVRCWCHLGRQKRTKSASKPTKIMSFWEDISGR